MSWRHHFERARRSQTPVTVDKQEVPSIPPRFEPQGLTIDGFWGEYQSHQGFDRVQITEYPTQYRVSVSNRTTSDPPGIQIGSHSTEKSDSLKQLALLGLGTLTAAAIGRAFQDSQKNTSPDPKQAHRVFISHSWAYKEHFDEIKKLLDDAHGFEYYDHSVSSDDPIDAQLPNHLRKKIREQIQSTSVVLVLAGMYVSYSDWIQEELKIANEMEKPIIGVTPTENERVPAVVQECVTEVVEADGTAILNAVKQHAI